jgi:hypothetical protein
VRRDRFGDTMGGGRVAIAMAMTAEASLSMKGIFMVVFSVLLAWDADGFSSVLSPAKQGLRDDEHPEQSEARQKELRHRLDAGAPFRAAIVRVNPGQRSPGIREQPELADKVSDTRITIESFDRVTRIRKRSHPSKEPSSFHPAPDRPPARVAESGFVVMRPQGPQERKIRGQSRPSG